MSEIIFPGLSLKFAVSSIAFTLFGVNVHWYAILMVGSIALTLLIIIKKNGTFGIKSEDLLDAALIVIPAAFIGARLYYILFHLDIYLNDPISIFNLRTGGLAIYGAIIGGLISLILFCKKRKIKILDVTDYIVPMLAFGQSIGRWGNFLNTEAYGVETNLPWRMGITIEGVYKEVHPTFVYESLVTFFLFILLTFLTKKRKYSGELTYIYLFFYAFARFFIENLRTDSLMFFNIRISAFVSVLICVGICCIFAKNKIKEKKRGQNNN